MARLVRSVTRVVSGAMRAAARDPVLLALAAVAIALAVVLARRKEGLADVEAPWQFTGKETQLSGKDADFVQRKCAAGMTWGGFKGHASWRRFAKYDENKVWEECRKGVDQLSNEYLDRSKTAEEGAKDAGCRAPCTSELLRGGRPCANSNNEKCCRMNKKTGKLTDCVFKSHAATRDKELTRKITDTQGCKNMYGSKSTWDGEKCVKTVKGVTKSCTGGKWCKAKK